MQSQFHNNVHMKLNGKGWPNWLWSTWLQSCFRSFKPVNPIQLFFLIEHICSCIIRITVHIIRVQMQAASRHKNQLH